MHEIKLCFYFFIKKVTAKLFESSATPYILPHEAQLQ